MHTGAKREQEVTLHHLVYHQKSASLRPLCDFGMLGIYLFAWVLCLFAGMKSKAQTLAVATLVGGD